MSAAFMFSIAVMYLGGCVSFCIEGKYLWATVCVCWGLGNALLGYMALE